MKKVILYDQIKTKRRNNLIWILVLVSLNLFMIISILFCPSNEDGILSRILRIFPPFILASLIYLWQEMRYFLFVSRKYNDTVFSIHPKRERFTNPEKYELKTFKNRIIYRKKNDHSFEGEIVLDLINLKYGKGVHNIVVINDNKNDDYSKEDQFGLSQFIVTKDKIFEESPYIKPKKDNFPYGEPLYQVRIWLKENS